MRSGPSWKKSRRSPVNLSLSDQTVWMVAAVALLVVAVLALVALMTSLRLGRDQRERCAELERELAQLKTGMVNMGQRLLAMEKRSLSVASSTPATESRPYNEANQLLAAGVDLDEVASRCGLSRAEASLLEALRKRNASPDK